MSRKRSKPRYSVPELGQTENRRPARVGDSIRNELATLLLQKIKDPRVALVSITSVKVTNDLKNAIVYFVCRDDAVQMARKGLMSAQGFLRSSLAKSLALRYVPKLTFEHDLSIARHDEMNRIFKEIENERQSGSQ